MTASNKLVKVVFIDSDVIRFDDNSELFSYHEQDCCEYHYLDFSQHSLDDFDDLEFDLSSSSFFERVENYGIRLLPTNGHPISVPGYGNNSGYYSSNLKLVLKQPDFERKFDITDCQEIRD